MTYDTPPTVTARPILAIHGSASSGAIWQNLAKDLEGERIVIAPDLPGYGKNASTYERCAAERFDWLGEVIDSLGGPIDIIGHSFGGCVAMRLANQHPERIGQIILYEPIIPAGAEGVEGTPMEELQKLWTDMRDNDVETAMGHFCDFWSGKGSWHQMSERAQSRLAASYESIILDFQQMFGGELSVASPSYDGSITLLCGDRSPPVVGYMADQLSNAHPQATKRLLNGLSHLAPVSNAHQVNSAIRNCLETGNILIEA